jgi:hypothetical protein
MKKETIPNWGIFGTHLVGLSIVPVDVDEDTGKTVYSGIIDYLLDTGDEKKDNDPKTRKHISIFTDVSSTDIDDIIKMVVEGIGHLHMNMFNLVFVMNDEGEIIKQIELDLFFGQDIDEEDDSLKAGEQENTTSTVLH